MADTDYASSLLQSPFAKQRIRQAALRLATHMRCPWRDADDVAQDLWLRLLVAGRAFDPGRGSVEAFVVVVVRNVARQLHRTHFTPKWQFAIRQSSNFESLDTIPDSQNETDRDEFAEEMGVWLNTLPSDLRGLSEALKTETLSQVARHRNTPRSTLQRQVQKLRTDFDRFQNRNQ